MTYVVPDVEKAVRDWIRTLPAVVALGTDSTYRAWFNADPRATFPYVLVRRVGSITETSDAPIIHRMLQLDFLDDVRQRTRCHALASAVEAALLEIRQATLLSADVVCYGATIQSSIDLPDPGSAQPRIAMTVEVTVKSLLAV